MQSDFIKLEVKVRNDFWEIAPSVWICAIIMGEFPSQETAYSFLKHADEVFKKAINDPLLMTAGGMQ